MKMLGKTGSIKSFLPLQFFVVFIVYSIAWGEVVIARLDPGWGLFYDCIVLVSLLVLSTLRYVETYSNLFLSLSLAPLIRVISLSLPLIYVPRYLWYLVASIPVFAATLVLMRVQGIGFRDFGIPCKKLLVQGLIALTGVPFGIIESFILKPEPLVVGLQLGYLILLAVSLIFSTGFVEELAFRGVMQKNVVEASGERLGIILVAAVFASLHVSWLSVLEVVFVFCIGLFYGFLTLKTGSIVGVSFSHGIINVYLFMVSPSIKLISI